MESKIVKTQRCTRWIRNILIVLASLGLAFFGFLLIEHVRGHFALSRYIRGLQEQGEQVTRKEFMQPVQPGENGFPEVLAAAKELKPGKLLSNSYPPRMTLTPSGRAIVGFREESWVEDKLTNHWDSLAAELKTNAALLQRVQSAMKKPVLNGGPDLDLWSSDSLAHLTAGKKLAQWFGPRVALALHEGRTRETLEDLLTETELPRLLAADRIAISELVRNTIASIARGDTWEALQAEGWTDGDLAQLQRAWEGLDFAEAMVRALEGERIFAWSTYERMRQSNKETYKLLSWTSEFLSQDATSWWERTLREMPAGDATADFLKEQVFCRLWRFAWLDQDHLHYLRFLQGLIALGRDATRHKSLQTLQPLNENLVLEFSNKGVYDRARYHSEVSVSSLSRILHRAMRAETERSMVIAAIAIKRYKIGHGTLPESLNALVPEFLTAVPVDYMDGKPLKFHLESAGGFKLYSVGEDGNDDGGDASRAPDRTRYGLWNRKDVVWPAPATAEEVEAWRSKSVED